MSKYRKKVPTNKVRRPERMTFRFSLLETLALQKLAGDGKISKVVRSIIHTSERYKRAYKEIYQTLNKEVKDESILS